MIVYRKFLVLLLLAAGSVAWADDVDAFLQKARAQLGSEKALKDVESLHYMGVVKSPDGKKLSDLELVFDKPNRQLLREKREGVISQTAVNGFEGYIMNMNPDNPEERRIQVLRPSQVKRLMSNAVENLYFFEGPERMRGGEIQDDGVVEYQGKDARKITFSYPNKLYYTRYFDPQTAELVATVSSEGMTMVEKETLVASDIVFPKIVVTYNEIGEEMHQVEFTEVKVNGDIKTGLFDFPE